MLLAPGQRGGQGRGILLHGGGARGRSGRLRPVVAPTRQELEDSTGQPCDEAVLQEVSPAGTEVIEVSAYGTTSQVRLSADTMFLTRFRGGWLVLAAACRPARADTYECGIKGN